jgi:hypothetical protein
MDCGRREVCECVCVCARVCVCRCVGVRNCLSTYPKSRTTEAKCKRRHRNEDSRVFRAGGHLGRVWERCGGGRRKLGSEGGGHKTDHDGVYSWCSVRERASVAYVDYSDVTIISATL